MANQKEFTHFEPQGYPQPVVACSYGIKVKPDVSFIFVSGLAPLDDEGKGLVGFDVHAQTIRVMEIMRKVLEGAGATLNNIVRMRVWLTDVDGWEKCCDAYSRYFDKLPAVSLEVVSGFIFGPGQMVQIDAIAAL